jgi:hypothetical protein
VAPPRLLKPKIIMKRMDPNRLIRRFILFGFFNARHLFLMRGWMKDFGLKKKLEELLLSDVINVVDQISTGIICLLYFQQRINGCENILLNIGPI